jgi:hypothetical protein
MVAVLMTSSFERENFVTTLKRGDDIVGVEVNFVFFVLFVTDKIE